MSLPARSLFAKASTLLGFLLLFGNAEARPAIPYTPFSGNGCQKSIKIPIPISDFFQNKFVKITATGQISVGEVCNRVVSNPNNPAARFMYITTLTDVEIKYTLSVAGDITKMSGIPNEIKTSLPLGAIPLAPGVAAVPLLKASLGIEGKVVVGLQPTLRMKGQLVIGGIMPQMGPIIPFFYDGTQKEVAVGRHSGATQDLMDPPITRGCEATGSFPGGFQSKFFSKLGIDLTLDGLVPLAFASVKYYFEADMTPNFKGGGVTTYPTFFVYDGLEPEWGLYLDVLQLAAGPLGLLLGPEPRLGHQFNLLKRKLFEGTPYSDKPPICHESVKGFCDLWVKWYPPHKCDPNPPSPKPPAPPQPPAPPSPGSNSMVSLAGPNCPHGVDVRTPDNTWYSTKEGGYAGEGCTGEYLWTHSNGAQSSGDTVTWFWTPGLRQAGTCTFSVFVPATHSIVSTAHPAYYEVYAADGTGPAKHLGGFTIDQLNSNGWVDSGRSWPLPAEGSIWVTLDDRGPTGYGIAADTIRAYCKEGGTGAPPPPHDNNGVYGPGAGGVFQAYGTWYDGGGVGYNGKEVWTNELGAWAVWVPNDLDPEMVYQLEAYIPNNHANAANAHYVVTDQSVKPTDVYVDQNRYTNQWALLGRFCPRPDPITGIGVLEITLKNEKGGSEHLGADDIRALPVGRCTGGL
ncbi:hypothetical protein [Candidatus Methylocalor cossyra]|uniref:Uncharacterized protein n=1 Tax=Candidatus Methylocalor cossyra TaxID=3108543 RepID=A0ABM9NJX8_9GAMM